MAWFFDRKSRRFLCKSKGSGNADLILERLKQYLQNTDKPVSMLCGFWDDQRDAISYQELRMLVESGTLDPVTLDEWQQDYSRLVTEKMPEIWGDAILAGSTSQPVMDGIASTFVFEPTRTTVLDWVQRRAAQLVTNSTEEQRKAIAMFLEDQARNRYSVDELAKLIRPCIGLTRGQAAAVQNFYDSLVASLTEEHPRTSPEKIQAKARDKAIKYAERLHRQRALTIAITEMAYAYNFGADEGTRQAQAQGLLGKCVKRWSTSGDDRVCKRCEDLSGKEIGMDENFFEAILLAYPEAGKLPPIHPRCACAVEYIEVEPPAIRFNGTEPETVGRTGLNGQGWSVTTNTPLKPENPSYGCMDVTQEWLNNAVPNSHTIRDVAVLNQDGIRYEVDGSNVKLEYDSHEKDIAKLLENWFGGELLMLPTVKGKFKGISTPDYIFRGERLDLKTLKNSTSKRAVFNRLNPAQEQASIFVLDITNNPLGRTEILRQIEGIYSDYSTRGVNVIIVVENNQLIRVYERKK